MSENTVDAYTRLTQIAQQLEGAKDMSLDTLDGLLRDANEAYKLAKTRLDSTQALIDSLAKA